MNERLTALHEGAHAVLCVVFGLELGIVRLSDDPTFTKSNGYVITSGDDWTAETADRHMNTTDDMRLPSLKDYEGESIIGRLLMLLAGGCAVRKLTGGCDVGINGDHDDYRRFSRLLCELMHYRDVNMSVIAAQSALITLAEREIDRHWLSIVRTADALQQQRTLSGDQVRAIVEDAEGTPNQRRRL